VKNIVLVHNSIKTVYAFRKNNIKAYIDEGYSVSVVAPDTCDVASINLLSLGVTEIKTPKKNNLNFILKVAFLNWEILKLRVSKDNFFICHFISTFVLSFFSLVPFNRRLIVYIEGIGSLFSKNKYLLNLVRLMLKICKGKILYCNIHEKNILGDGSVTGGIGINLTEFVPSLRRSHTHTLKLLYIGRLIKDKGVYDAVQVLRLLISDGVDVEMTFIGDIYPQNPTSLSYHDITRLETEFRNQVDFKGYLNNLSSIYNDYDALILPSKLEGFPVCVMEASACGVPSICYDVPGCRDAIKHGVNGYLVPYGKTQKMSEIIKEKFLIGKLGIDKNICRNYAVKHFDANIKTKHILLNINNRF